jgi:hypothetical protein
MAGYPATPSLSYLLIVAFSDSRQILQGLSSLAEDIPFILPWHILHMPSLQQEQLPSLHMEHSPSLQHSQLSDLQHSHFSQHLHGIAMLELEEPCTFEQAATKTSMITGISFLNIKSSFS